MTKRTLPRTFGAALLLVVACGDDDGGSGGGTTSTTTTGGQTSSQSSTSQGTSTAQTTTTGQSSTSTGGEGGADCATIIAAVDDSLADAKVCNPLIDFNECTQVLEGPCCDVAVNPDNAAAVQAFQDAMADLVAAHCTYDCPDIPCIEDPIGSCTGNTPMGSCIEQPPN